VFVVWYFFMIYNGFGHETFSLLKLCGFFLIIFGVLCFNKVIDVSSMIGSLSQPKQMHSTMNFEPSADCEDGVE